MQIKTIEPGIEVAGAGVDAFVEAFKLFPSVVLKRLASQGIGTLRPRGEVEIDRQAWYPLDKWLVAFHELASQVGPRAVFQVGQYIPKHAVFPPSVTDIHSAIASIDVAYHMNHRKDGKVMFDPSTGQMLGGIGNYGYKPIANERRVISVVDNPYPCDCDRGLITAMAARFERMSRVVHDERSPCRKNGADSCTYIITW